APVCVGTADVRATVAGVGDLRAIRRPARMRAVPGDDAFRLPAGQADHVNPGGGHAYCRLDSRKDDPLTVWRDIRPGGVINALRRDRGAVRTVLGEKVQPQPAAARRGVDDGPGVR